MRAGRGAAVIRGALRPELIKPKLAGCSMNIHEYQAKAVLREFGVPTPKGIPAFTADEAVKAAEQLGGPVWVVKAQIHAGGRGKAGGVKVVKSIDDVKKEADAHPRLDAGHAPDRPEGQGRQPPLHRGRLGDRQGILPVDAGRPRHRRASRSSSRPKAAWTSRRSRTTRRTRSSPSRSIRWPASARITCGASPRRSASTPICRSR